MHGKIIRGIAGFYYVHVPKIGILECKAKGAFRNNKIKPLVGDNVDVEILDKEKMLGNISDILDRKNSIIRPSVANVDQAVVIFAASFPKPNLNLLDRFLLMMQTQKVPTAICFNKSDDIGTEELEAYAAHYANTDCEVFCTSTVTGDGVKGFREHIIGKTTVLAGPSGVGKSSLMNVLFPEADMEIGAISEKIKRGKHTTRHSELFSLGDDTYVMDTPGFTSLRLPELEKEEIKDYYPEFDEYIGECRFQGCVHISEPDCAVKKAVEEKKISDIRYENYKKFYDEINNIRK